MGFNPRRTRVFVVASLLSLLGVLALGSSSASATLTGAHSEFDLCPVDLALPAGNFRCVHSEIDGGFIKVGKWNVPIAATPDTMDFGFYIDEGMPPGQAAMITPTTGEVFGGPAQPISLGSRADAIANALGGRVKQLLQLTASIELAGPVTPGTVIDPTAVDTYFSLTGSLGAGAAAIRVPVKIHLNNPLLGRSCRIGSDADPIVLNLAPSVGPAVSFAFEARVLLLSGGALADSTFAAPRATGCGPFGLFNRVVDNVVGLPAQSGRNAVEIHGDSAIATAAAVVAGF